jgi:NADH-quinone oxidoreductase subunit N
VAGLAYYLPLIRTILLGNGGVRGRARFGLAVLAVGAALAVVSLAPQAVLEFTSFSK